MYAGGVDNHTPTNGQKSRVRAAKVPAYEFMHESIAGEEVSTCMRDYTCVTIHGWAQAFNCGGWMWGHMRVSDCTTLEGCGAYSVH